MIEQLTYMVDEICSGVEVYYSGRIGGQYLKTAFILCDDYTELMSKLFLLCDNQNWSEKKTNGAFKNYHNVMAEVEGVIRRSRLPDLAAVQVLLGRMKSRRDRRNRFFHSADLLDMNVTSRMCVESYCELLDYGLLLFSGLWADAVARSRNLETFELLLRLEQRGFSEPSINGRLIKILGEWPRNSTSSRRTGVQVAVHPEDLHLRLTVISGGSLLRDRLRVLLSTS